MPTDPFVCLVTGCSRPTGSGWLSAVELRDRGHAVVATMRDIEGRNREGAERLGRLVEVKELDVEIDRSVRATVGAVLARYGRLDAVISNAAHVPMGPLEMTRTGSLRRALDVNVLGTHRLVRAALPSMRERGAGVIVQISSINGFAVAPLFGSYCASKFALEAYSEALAYEIGHFGIRVAIIEPSAFATGLHTRGLWEPGVDRGPYAPLKAQYWDAALDEWVGTMEDPRHLAATIADAVEDPSTPLHVPVGGPAVALRADLRPVSDEELRQRVWEAGLDW